MRMPDAKDVLIAYNAQTQSVLAGTAPNLNLTAIDSNSSKLTIANNKVKIGKNVNFVDCVFNLSTWRRNNISYVYKKEWN